MSYYHIIIRFLFLYILYIYVSFYVLQRSVLTEMLAIWFSRILRALIRLPMTMPVVKQRPEPRQPAFLVASMATHVATTFSISRKRTKNLREWEWKQKKMIRREKVKAQRGITRFHELHIILYINMCNWIDGTEKTCCISQRIPPSIPLN